MGQAQPIPVNVRSVPRDPNFEPTESSVRITGSLLRDIEQKIERAYSEGKEEGIGAFQSSLVQLSAEVYGNVDSQLAKIHNDNINQSEKLAKELRNKLKTPKISSSLCADEEKALVTCLQKNCKKPLDCDSLAKNYTQCSVKAV